MTGIDHNHLRATLLGAVALIVAALVSLGPAAASSEAAECRDSSTPAYRLSEREAQRTTLCLVNKERNQRGMGDLRTHRRTQRAAEEHNRVMIQKRCFSHQCSGERDLLGRLEQSGYLPCDCSWAIAENIAWGSGSTGSPRSIVDAWMNSPPHRANILNRGFEHAGVAVDGGSPEGGGQAATYTMDFGTKG